MSIYFHFLTYEFTCLQTVSITLHTLCIYLPEVVQHSNDIINLYILLHALYIICVS